MIDWTKPKTEKFIKSHLNEVSWYYISKCQKLTEKFIKEHKDLVSWYYISQYQKLTEKFIKEHKDLVSWYCISKYQKLTEKFIKEHELTIRDNSWLYTSTKDKIDYIKKNTKYKVIKNKYIVAYKSIRSDNYSVFNFQYKYLVGKTYESHCDCNLDNENSFGLSAWTEEKALEYHSTGKLLKVKINIEDIGAIVHSGNKIRCFKFEVLKEV